MTVFRRVSIAAIISLGLSLGGCGFIAKDGPYATNLRSQAVVQRGAEPDSVKYVMINVAPDVLRAANDATFAMAPRFGPMARGPGPDVSIGQGDLLSVTVYESESGGLFVSKDATSRPGNYIQLPTQQVSASGEIVVPYVGKPIKVLGRTTRDVAIDIASSLKSRAIEPQAVVSIVEHRGNDIAVIGDVNQPQKFSLDPGGTRLMTAIARAGGPKYPAYETTVSIQRGNAIHKAWMSSIVNDPAQNVAMRPGDQVYVARNERVYMVLGATPSPGAIGGVNNRRFAFSNEKMSLAEAISTAGGLDTLRSDPQQFFLFRFERKSVLEQSGIDVSQYPADLVPTVYAVDMRQGASFFLADRFYMRDKDMIFVAEADAVDLQKFLNIASSLGTSAYNGAYIAK